MSARSFGTIVVLALLLGLLGQAGATGVMPSGAAGAPPGVAEQPPLQMRQGYERLWQDGDQAATSKLDARLRLAFQLWGQTEQVNSQEVKQPDAVAPQARALAAITTGLREQMDLHLDGPAPGVNALLRTTDGGAELRASGIPVQSTIGDVSTVYLPFAQLAEIAALPSVVAIEASQLLRPANNVSVPETGAPAVWSGYSDTGSEVIVGVIDSGVDPFHPDFIKPDGTTRIKYLLDFSDPGDPDSNGNLNGTVLGGTMYTEADINAALAAPGWFYRSTDTPKSIPDSNTSGTTSQIAVSQNATINSVAVDLQIWHTFVGDLRVTLTCPSGTNVILRDHTGGSNDDIVGTYSTTSCSGQNATGSWRLNVADTASGDTGTLIFWNLHVNRPVRLTDQVGHGTHVAGSAAGNGRATGGGLPAGTFKGMAPDADIIAVRGTRDYVGGFQSSDIVNALSFIDQKAGELGRPYVINLSLGGQIGPHDGSTLEERTIDNLVGSGKPGKVVVVSAGNEGERHIHASGQVPGNGTNEVSFDISSPSIVLVDIWYKGSDTFQVGFLDPNGQGINPVPILPPDEDCYSGGSNAVCIGSYANDPNNGDKEIFLYFYAVTTGRWRFVLHGYSVSNGHFDAWSQGAPFSSDIDDRMRVGMPGTARNAITVAAYTTKKQWIDVNGSSHNVSATIGAISAFSSDGPTRDGRQKPDIAAPGQVICSAFSGQSPAGGYGSVYGSAADICQDGRHGVMSGTSMSAPHVTGAVALLLKLDRNLDAAQLKTLLTTYTRRDSNTGSVPNSRWGYGKLDVAAAAAHAAPGPTNTPTSTPTPSRTPTSTRTPTDSPTRTPTRTVTPTRTPTGVWMNWADASQTLLLGSAGRQMTVRFGNVPLPATLTAQIFGGAAVFQDDSSILNANIASANGSYSFAVKPAAGAAPGQPFLLQVTLGSALLQRAGTVVEQTYLAAIFKPQAWTPTPTATPSLTPSRTPTLTQSVTPSRTPTSTPSGTPTRTPTPTSPGAGWVTIVSQDFEGSFPGAWTVRDVDGSSYGEYYWAKRTCRTYAGSNSGWAVGGGANGGGLGCGAYYPNGAYSRMMYGPFSLAGATAADLRFKLWLYSESNFDGLCRSASVDGVNFYGTCTTGNSSGWIDRVLDLANVYTLGSLLGQSQVWIALEFLSDSSITYSEGAYVDNVILRKCTSGSCPTAATEVTEAISDLVEIPREVTVREE